MPSFESSVCRNLSSRFLRGTSKRTFNRICYDYKKFLYWQLFWTSFLMRLTVSKQTNQQNERQALSNVSCHDRPTISVSDFQWSSRVIVGKKGQKVSFGAIVRGLLTFYTTSYVNARGFLLTSMSFAPSHRRQ